MIENNANTFYKEIERLLVAVDCIIFGFDRERLKLLLFKRKIEPFKDEWSLIGSFVKANESVANAANRILKESTGLTDLFLQELGCYSEVDRDAGARVISIAHYTLIRLEEQEEKLTKAYQAHWFDVEDIPNLILDHGDMVIDALKNLRKKAHYEPISFELLPEKFTIRQLKVFYDAVYQKTLDKRNFRKRILKMDILKKLDEKDKTTSRKGAFLYQFDKEKYEKRIQNGFNFEL